MKRIFKWTNVRLVLMFSAIGFLLAFSSKRNEDRMLVKSVVEFTGGDNLFITNESVNKLLIENKTDARTIRKDKVDLNRLESQLNAHEMIEKSEVFVTIDGVLKARVKQKTPIARVLDENGSFYIDYEGNTMPLSDQYSARVPLITGAVTDGNRKKIAEMFKIVHDDDFLRKNIIGATVSPTGNIVLANRNFSYQIDFGKTINMERKFSNYKAFFQKAVTDSTITKYKMINLKFTQQVVCSK
jgi:cell division protein FtsQ